MGEEVEGGEKEEGGRRGTSLGHFPRGATGFGPPGEVVQKGPKMVTMSAYGGGESANGLPGFGEIWREILGKNK